MSRYIDADILRKNEIARCHCVPCVGSNDNNYKDLDEVLDSCPTADVVEVVRCKDCKFYKDWGDCITCSHWTVFEDVSTEPNALCSYGERRDKCE